MAGRWRLLFRGQYRRLCKAIERRSAGSFANPGWGHDMRFPRPLSRLVPSIHIRRQPHRRICRNVGICSRIHWRANSSRHSPMPGNSFKYLITHSIHSISLKAGDDLQIQFYEPPNTGAQFVNGFQIVPIPEPSGFSIVIFGFLFVLLWRRRIF
jgi:hypothetical protein